jgi:hypothetical protein
LREAEGLGSTAGVEAVGEEPGSGFRVGGEGTGADVTGTGVEFRLVGTAAEGLVSTAGAGGGVGAGDEVVATVAGLVLGEGVEPKSIGRR